MRSRPMCALSTLAAIALAAVGNAQPTLPRVAAMGDSLSDEYAEQIYADQGRSWTQILVQAGRIDMGPTAAQAGIPRGDWGEPRRTGYMLNWARHGETTDWAMNSGQPAGAASSAATGAAEYVIMWIGGNDFHVGAYGTYNEIYYNRWTPEQTETFVAQRLSNLRSMAMQVKAAGGKIVLCSISDFSFMVWVWNVRPSAADRERVTLVMRNVRDRTRALANELGVVFLDMFQVNIDLFGWNPALRPTVTVGNVPINLHAWWEDPYSAFIDDGVHPRTIIQAVWAGAMLTSLRAGYRVDVPEFTEQDMLGAAGLPYGGQDTLRQVLRPMRSYVQNFRCRADFDLDGQVGVQDVLDFLAAYFTGDSRADIDGNLSLTLDDLFTYLNDYFSGCP